MVGRASQRSLNAKHVPFVVALCGLWAVGFEVMPLAHVVFHDVWEPHHHGAAEVDHDDGAEEGSPSSREHGKGSLAHRDLAVHVPAPSVPSIPQALLARDHASPCAYQGRLLQETTATHEARAPPCLHA